MDISRIKTLLAEEMISGPKSDGLDKIANLVGPLIATCPKEQITTKQLMMLAKQSLGWNISEDTSEVLMARLVKRGFLKAQKTNDGEQLFFRTQHEKENQTTLLDILSPEFHKFLKSYKTPINQNMEKINSLLSRDFSEFFSTTLDDFDSYADFESSISSYKSKESKSENWERYILCQFLYDIREQPSFDLCIQTISQVFIVRNIIEEYSAPPKVGSLNGLTIFLDTAPALSWLGVSGQSREQAAVQTFGSAIQLGAEIQILPGTTIEIRRVLNAVLGNIGWERYGPTASAIRRMEVNEAYVKLVAEDPETPLKNLGVTRATRTLNTFPNEHKYFPQELVDELGKEARWTQRDLAIRCDIEAVAIAMRMRQGRHQRGMLKSRALVVTQNGSFFRQARDFCLRKNLTSELVAPCVIRQKDFAAQIWLSSQISETKDIPTAQLYSSCELIASNHKSILEKFKEEARSLSEEEAAKLQALLEDRRYISMASNYTLNDPNSINADNSRLILKSLEDSMREAIKNQIAPEIAMMREKQNDINKKYEEVLITHKKTLTEKSELNQALVTAETEVESRRRAERRAKKKEIQEIAELEKRLTDLSSTIEFMKGNTLNVIQALIAAALTVLAYVNSAPLGVSMIILLGYVLISSILYSGPLGWINKRYLLSKANKFLIAEFSAPEVEKYQIQVNPNFPNCLPNDNVLHANINPPTAF